MLFIILRTSVRFTLRDKGTKEKILCQPEDNQSIIETLKNFAIVSSEV